MNVHFDGKIMWVNWKRRVGSNFKTYNDFSALIFYDGRDMGEITCGCRWLEKDGDTLIAAADVLGGPDWARHAKVVVDVARNGGPITARVHAIKALSRLLQGCHADGLEGSGAWPFTWLHPDDPRATNAMLCAEALDGGLRAMEALRLAGLTTRGVTA